MHAELNLQEHNLEDTLKQLQEQIRAQPAEAKHRIFLFQLLVVVGQWDRALNQLNVLRDMDASTLPMAQTYQEAIQCEGLRAQVYEGQRSPLIFGEPEQWLALLFQALQLDADGKHEQAQELRNKALEQAPATTGSIDDQTFAWLADADPRFGPTLEAIVNGRYYWIPFQRVARIELEAPSDLRDMVWLPAQFTWANGGQAVGLIPTRYPGSENSDDDNIRMAHKTDWIEVTADVQFGLGQRLLATDQDDYALLDSRLINLDSLDTTDTTDTTESADG